MVIRVDLRQYSGHIFIENYNVLQIITILNDL